MRVHTEGRGEEEERPDPFAVSPAFAVIGRSTPVLGAEERVLGAGRPAEPIPPHALIGAALSLDDRRRIESVDLSRARLVEGVHAVLGPADAAVVSWAGGEVLRSRETRYPGEPVAAVAAETAEAAVEALGRIRLRTHPLGAAALAIDLAAALGERAPVVDADYPRNLGPVLRLREGDLAAAVAESDAVVEDGFAFQGIAVAEPCDPACAADWSGAGDCALWLGCC
jgi:CO/xanthine dehydrogenase Mo-binding subunit